MLGKALKDNPDIRVAEAKLGEAGAELNRTRLQVMQKVAALHHAVESQKSLIKEAEARLGRVTKLAQSSAISQEEVLAAEQVLIRAKAKLAEIEAEMPYLFGQQPGHVGAAKTAAFSPDGRWVITQGDSTVRLWDATTGKEVPRLTQPVLGTMAEKIRKALDAPVTVDYKDKPLVDLLKELQQKTPGVSFLTMIPQKDQKDLKVTLHLSEPVALGAAIQALEDTLGLRFAVREYGMLVTFGELPRGVMPLQAFWKGDPGGEKAKGSGPEPKQ
jgi:hypothetical protein